MAPLNALMASLGPSNKVRVFAWHAGPLHPGLFVSLSLSLFPSIAEPVWIALRVPEYFSPHVLQLTSRSGGEDLTESCLRLPEPGAWQECSWQTLNE